MINEETQSKISDLGFDVSKLIEAVKSEEEISLDVPTINKGFTQEEMATFGKNRFDEGKNAMDEMRAKAYKEKYGLDIEGKNLDDVVDAYGLKRFNEAKPSDGNKELQDNFQSLQGKYTDLEKKLADKENEYKSKIFQTTVRQQLVGSTPKGLPIDSDKAVSLYLMENKIQNNDGSAVVLDKNGEIQKDNLLNPIDVGNHFASWLDSSGLITKSGMGGDDSKGGSTSPKFRNAAEFTDWCYANDKAPLSSEMQKYYLDNKQ